MSTNIHQIAIVAKVGIIPSFIQELEEFKDGDAIKYGIFGNVHFSYDKSVLYVLLKDEEHFGESYDFVDIPSLINATATVKEKLEKLGYTLKSDLVYVNQVYNNSSDNPLDLLTSDDAMFNNYLKPMNIL
jgi:hypothetical protein